MLTKDQLQLFLTENVNEKTFPIYTILLNLNDNNLFNKIIELLYHHKINIWSFSNVPSMNDIFLQNFVDNYDIRFKPKLPFNDLEHNDFIANEYLFDSSISESPINKLLVQWNTYKNKDIPIKDVILVPYDVKYGMIQNSVYYSFSNFINDFNTEVLSKVLEYFKTDSIYNVFDSTKVGLVSVEGKALYNSIFDKYLPVINNTDLYKVMVRLNSEPAIIDLYPTESSELFNFNRFHSSSLEDLISFELFDLASKGRGYTSTEMEELVQDIKNSKFSFRVRDEFLALLFKISKLDFYTRNTSLGFNTSILQSDLNVIEKSIENFKKLILVLMEHISNNILLYR